MKTSLFRTPDDPGDTTVPDKPFLPEESGTLWAMTLKNAERSCCCPAKPVVAAILARRDRTPVELLLCRHHFLASRERLKSTGAAVFDGAGEPVTGDDVAVN